MPVYGHRQYLMYVFRIYAFMIIFFVCIVSTSFIVFVILPIWGIYVMLNKTGKDNTKVGYEKSVEEERLDRKRTGEKNRQRTDHALLYYPA